ncbi:MAG: GyrI-like domain-containing protein [Maribacter sp.]|uniref:GyrI-like domain-containing protein n=1 Tax=Maribacter sp. TaxID=1897614 RepID=UPI003C737D64
MSRVQEIEPFKIIGIAVQSTNEGGKSAKDMGDLWGRFYSEEIASKIPNKIDETIYAIYTDYESDYTGSYMAIIGLRVNKLNNIPDGMAGRTFEGGTYKKFIAEGEMPKAIVKQWQYIWEQDKKLNRKYTADFEVYKQDSEIVEILIAID